MSKAFKPGTPLTFTAKLRAKQPFDEPAPSPPAAEPTTDTCTPTANIQANGGGDGQDNQPYGAAHPRTRVTGRRPHGHADYSVERCAAGSAVRPPTLPGESCASARALAAVGVLGLGRCQPL